MSCPILETIGEQCGWHLHPILVGWKTPIDPLPIPLTTCSNCGARSRNIGGWGTDGRYVGIVCAKCKAAPL